MSRLHTIGINAMLLAAMITSLAAPALALSATSTADTCYLVVTHVSTAMNNLHDTNDKRAAAYADAVTRVSKELEAAQGAGYDSAQLATDFKILNADIVQFNADRQTLEADLTNAQSASQTGCTSMTGQFADALAKARAQLPNLQNDDVKIRVDIRQKLILDMRAYVAWLRTKIKPGSVAE